jgi:glutathione gamma-glutamylcysteinyltransferase
MSAATSFYRRELPAGLVEFASAEGRVLFREALAAGTMEGYFALAEQFHTQSEPSFCGLGTLVIVLNALAIDPGRAWRGPWRWFGEELLDCCRPLDVVKEKGVTFAQLACLARCNGAQVDARRASEATLDQFRDAVRRASTTSGEPHLVVSYRRATLGQTGEGHFSPIGGFHEARDLVLVLDVARFKYPPHWVPVTKLWEAMLPADAATGKSRGFFELSRAAVLPASDEAFDAAGRDEVVALREHLAALAAYCATDFSET